MKMVRRSRVGSQVRLDLYHGYLSHEIVVGMSKLVTR